MTHILIPLTLQLRFAQPIDGQFDLLHRPDYQQKITQSFLYERGAPETRTPIPSTIE